jgi:hypothetical protein
MGPLSARQQAAKVRGLHAINLVRRGKSPSLTAAARAEGTTVRSIWKLLPAALFRDSRGRIRVKAGDSYAASVEIVTHAGAVVVNARGARERSLAGRHRAVWRGTLRNEQPPSALEKFRGKTVGGRELISDYDRLVTLVKGGALDDLDILYVSPETRG